MEVKIVDDFLDSIDLKEVQKRIEFPAKWNTQVSDTERRDHVAEFLELIVSGEEFYNKYLFDKVKEHLDGE